MLNRTFAIILLLITLLPLAIFFYAYSMMTTAPFANGNLDTFQGLILPNAVLLIVLISGYTAFIFKSNRVPKDKKVLWVIALVVFHVFSMLAFWYSYIWKRLNTSAITHQT